MEESYTLWESRRLAGKKINTVRILLYQSKNKHIFYAYKVCSVHAI